MNARPSLSAGRALVLYVIYVTVFVIGGGIGAGIPSFLFELISSESMQAGNNFFLYAIMFGVTGFIAYRLARRVAED